MRGVDVTMRTHQQQTVDVLPPQHEIDEPGRRTPCPLQIVDEEHDRPLPRRDRAQHVDTHLLRPHLGGQWITRFGRHAQQRREFGHRRGEQPRVHPDRPQDPLADLGQLLLRLGQQEPAQRPKRLVDGVELQIPPVLVELAGHEPAVRTRHHRAQLVDEHRLAHARCPTDQHPTAPPGQRLRKRRFQRRHLVAPPHQPRRRQQPERNIVLADAHGNLGMTHPLQVVDQALGGLVPVVGLLLQQMEDDLRQRGGYGRVHGRVRRRDPRQMIMREAQRVPDAERRLTSRQLVQGGAQRVQI
jgi:hypothetical protein